MPPSWFFLISRTTNATQNPQPRRPYNVEEGGAETNGRLSLADKPGFEFLARLSLYSLCKLNLYVGKTVIAQIKNATLRRLFKLAFRKTYALSHSTSSLTNEAVDKLTLQVDQETDAAIKAFVVLIAIDV